MNDNLFIYVLRLADDSLILSQRLSGWCYNAPFLEEDIALTNIALDYLGRSNSLYEYASSIDKRHRTPDELAFKRDVNEFYNCLLVEQPNGHFGDTIARQFIIDAFYLILFSFLKDSSDQNISAIAEKSIKETTYHFRHSSKWVVRLGDGTQESHYKISHAFNNLWKYTGELFANDSISDSLKEKKVCFCLKEIERRWISVINDILNKANIKIENNFKMEHGGRTGNHSGGFKKLLDEMQYLQRTYPDAKW